MTEAGVIALAGIGATLATALGAPAISAFFERRRRESDRSYERLQELREVLDATAVAMNGFRVANDLAIHAILQGEGDPEGAWRDRVEAVRQLAEAHARLEIRLGVNAAICDTIDRATAHVGTMGSVQFCTLHGYEIEPGEREDAGAARSAFVDCQNEFAEQSRALIGPKID